MSHYYKMLRNSGHKSKPSCKRDTASKIHSQEAELQKHLSEKRII